MMTMALGATMVFGADLNGSASAPKDTAAKLLAESRTARQTALQMAEQLKRKNADLGGMQEHVATVEQSAVKIQGLLKELENSGANFNERQRAALDMSQKLAEVMNVFVENKKTMVAGAATREEISQFRGQALGVAKRAELIERHVAKMGL
jgi:hypothetical protein